MTSKFIRELIVQKYKIICIVLFVNTHPAVVHTNEIKITIMNCRSHKVTVISITLPSRAQRAYIVVGNASIPPPRRQGEQWVCHTQGPIQLHEQISVVTIVFHFFFQMSYKMLLYGHVSPIPPSTGYDTVIQNCSDFFYRLNLKNRY